MSIQAWTYLIVIASFALYIGIAIYTRVRSTRGFYVAGQGVPAPLNGMATGADWMSAASFISMAGLIGSLGFTGSVYLIGWTGGYVLLALLLAPYLRKFGRFTVPEFVGDRYYSDAARVVAVICAIFVSFTYVAGQMRGVGVVFSRFLEVDVNTGVVIGMVLVFFYATLGGMRGITYTQVAQYVVLIIAYIVPAAAISHQMTGQWIPQVGFGSTMVNGDSAGVYLLEALDGIHRDLGLPEYTAAYVPGKKSMLDVLAVTLALMAGTAGLPHVIIRFYTTKTVRAARWSAFWALLFIGILYTTAPAVAAFARVNLIQTLHEKPYEERPEWFRNWEATKLVAWVDKNGDGKVQFADGSAFLGKPNLSEDGAQGASGEPLLNNELTSGANELYVDKDIMVLANPEIARLPAWVVALVAAGGLAAALSTAAGLLMVISSSISHDLLKRTLKPDLSEQEELRYARIAAGVAVVIAGAFGIKPPGFVGEVVAFAFGLAASSFFPAIVLGVFTKSTTKEGAIAGMLTGIVFTSTYIIYFKFVAGPEVSAVERFGVSPEGIGTVGMILNFIVAIVVSRFTPPPPAETIEQIDRIRAPGD